MPPCLHGVLILFKIDLVNMQAIGEAHIELEENSIVEFVGDNSNGKSIISKVIEYLTKGDLVQKDVRQALIKDYQQQAVFIMTHDKEQLAVLLREELKDSFIMYVEDIDKEEKILRQLSDTEAVKAMLDKFGFRIYANGDICLQVFPTFGPIPFVTTSGAVNNEIVDDITTDKIADEFLKSFSTITFPVFKERIGRLRREKESDEIILANMEMYDYKEYESVYDELKKVYDKIKDYKFYQMNMVEVPEVRIFQMPAINIKPLPVVKVYPLIPKFGYITETLRDYVKVLNGECPTCGRPLVEHK